MLGVSDCNIFNENFSFFFNNIKKNENVTSVEIDSMFINENKIYMSSVEKEEIQYTRIIRFNKKCDIEYWDWLYT